ncbi:hypothetical protein D049_0043B, partial [Vibrio parahaemolyticus VPTS-2010]
KWPCHAPLSVSALYFRFE